MDTPSRTTELEAVNVCLALLGESPVNTLVPPYGVDVANARNLLLEASKDVQSEGWAFNEETNTVFVRDGSNNIPVPQNVLRIDADTDPGVDVVFRTDKLYDKKARTFIFDHDVTCEVVYFFPFDQIPECARRYIMIMAARRIQARFLGSAEQHHFTELDETKARVRLMNEEGQTGDYNILNDRDIFYTVRRGHQRRFR